MTYYVTCVRNIAVMNLYPTGYNATSTKLCMSCTTVAFQATLSDPWGIFQCLAVIFMPLHSLCVFCAQLTRALLAISKCMLHYLYVRWDIAPFQRFHAEYLFTTSAGPCAIRLSICLWMMYLSYMQSFHLLVLIFVSNNGEVTVVLTAWNIYIKCRLGYWMQCQ